MFLLLLSGLERELLEWLFVISLWLAFISMISVYAAAGKTGQEKPGRWALTVGFSYLGTAIVGFPVFLVTMVYFISEIEKMEKRDQLEGNNIIEK